MCLFYAVRVQTIISVLRMEVLLSKNVTSFSIIISICPFSLPYRSIRLKLSLPMSSMLNRISIL